MIVFTLVLTSVSNAVGHRARVLSVNVHGLSYGQTFCQSIIEIVNGILWCYHSIETSLNEILRGPIYLLGFKKK